MMSKWITCAIATLFAIAGWLQSTPPSLAHSRTVPFTEPMIAALPFAQFFAGQRPQTLGVKDGQLAACPNSPNCVSSQAPDGDAQHKIAPLAYTSSPAEAMAKLKDVVARMERAQIVESSDDYLYAEFTSKLMGFVDDVEFHLDPSASVIHVRSASRLGQSDLGVNRKRVEEIRAKFGA